MSAASWLSLGTLDSMPRGIRTVKHGSHQLAVIHGEDGVHVIDNRCPHEGYPLAQGELQGCVLTCTWHNWKFDVRDGACILGGEGVRRYPVRIQDGVVEVDLAPTAPEELWRKASASLDEAIHRSDVARGLRDAVRLLEAGYGAERVILDVARHDARHAEYGSTHVLPTAEECARMLPRFEGSRAIEAIAPVIDLCADEDARLPRRERPEPVAGGSSEAFRAAVEAQDAARAEGMLRHALASGVPVATVAGWLHAAVADHFTDFGHSLIYLVKAEDLLARAAGSGATELQAADEILGALTYSLVVATREDQLPYMRPYFGKPATGDRPALPAEVAAAALDAPSPAAAMEVLGSALAGDASYASIAAAFVHAGAERLLRFDPAVDEDPELAEGWLWASHRLTFASAVRTAIERVDRPTGAKLLVQAMAFIHSGAPMDVPAPRRTPLVPRASSAPEVVEAVIARRTDEALARCAGYLDAGGDATELRSRLEDHCLRAPFTRPIFVCHAIKTNAAAFDELARIGGIAGRTAVLAAVKLLASRVEERRLHASALGAMRFVVEGRTPRKLTQ